MPTNPKEPWAERWRENRTGWDQGREHPYLMELLDMGRRSGRLPEGARIFEPGCGRAHNAMAMVSRGYAVKALDFVPDAIAAAKKLYSHPRLELAVGNALEVANDEANKFDAIFDRAMFCALDPSYREAYIEACHDRLKPGGLFMGILFSEIQSEKEGPPFAVTMEELLRLLKTKFTLCEITTKPGPGKPDIVVEELLVIARKVEQRNVVA